MLWPAVDSRRLGHLTSPGESARVNTGSLTKGTVWMKSGRSDRWERLGALLIQRRTQISPRFHSRGAFCEATGLKYRLVYDIEEARRANFGASTLAAIEAAYRLEPGAIMRFLAGGELEPQPAAPPAVPPRSRDRKLPVLDVDDEEGLRPFVLSVRRDLLAAAGFRFGPGREVPDLPEVEEYLASLPGALIFAADHEARVWDYEPMSAQERLRLIAVLRQMGAAARDAAEEPGERNAVLARAT